MKRPYTRREMLQVGMHAGAVLLSSPHAPTAEPVVMRRQQRLPFWYELNRVQAHLGLSDAARVRPAFEGAGAMIRPLGARVMTRVVNWHDKGPWWPSSVGRPAEFSASRNVARRIIDEAHGAGLRFIAYYWFRTEAYFAERYGKWVARNPDGSAIQHARGVELCLNSPYGEIVGRRIAELVEMGVDGVYLDGRHQPSDGCWCEYCAARFARETGLSMPVARDEEDPQYRELLGFYNRTVERLLEGFQRIVRAGNPDCVLVASATFVPALWNPRMTTEWVRGVDVAKSEFRAPINLARRFYAEAGVGAGQPPTELQQALGFTVLRDAAEGRPPHIWVSGLETTGDLLTATSAILSYGCVANLNMPGTRIPDPGVAPCFDLGEKVGAVLAHARPLRWVGLVHSEKARDRRAPDRARQWREVIAPLVYAFQALAQVGVPVGVLTDGQLERAELDGYQLLFIPLLEELSDHQAVAIEGFRRRGGRVVASDPNWRWHDLAKHQQLFATFLARLPGGLDAAPVRVVRIGLRRVHAVPYFSEDGRRRIIAVANDFREVGRRRRRGVPQQLPRAVPSGVVEVRFGGFHPRRVTEAISGRRLPIGTVSGAAAVRLPAFQYMSLVVAER